MNRKRALERTIVVMDPSDLESLIDTLGWLESAAYKAAGQQGNESAREELLSFARSTGKDKDTLLERTRTMDASNAQEPITDCILRVWKGKDRGEVIALFPNEIEGNDTDMISSYMHVGQHGSASYSGVMMATHPAYVKDPDVRALIRELEGEPYNYRLRLRTRRNNRTRVKGSQARK